MGKVINLLLAFIAYVCIATVITLALVIGYWWHTEQLTDEKLFRIMALLHDVDLNQIAEAHRKSGDEVPPEEPSLVDISHQQQILDRNHEVKLLALQRGSQEYHHGAHSHPKTRGPQLELGRGAGRNGMPGQRRSPSGSWCRLPRS